MFYVANVILLAEVFPYRVFAALSWCFWHSITVRSSTRRDSTGFHTTDFRPLPSRAASMTLVPCDGTIVSYLQNVMSHFKCISYCQVYLVVSIGRYVKEM